MKSFNRIFRNTLVVGAIALTSNTFAGNEDRVGSAGASELLINPWARSSAWADAGVSTVNGLEATYTNIAGLAFTEKTQIKFNHTFWLGSAGISLNSAGFAQRISEESVLSVSIQAYGFGDLPITTVDVPEGGIGTFSPRKNIFNVGYARSFSQSIYGGFNLKVVSESISNLKATGVAFDAGIRYVTGEQDQMKFGIALKNVGPTMKFSGDGLAYQVNYQSGGDNTVTLEQRSAAFELPSQLLIGASYDFIFNEESKLTAAFGFTANSFSNDQYRLGLDYGMSLEKAAFNVRAGYVLEKNNFNAETRTNALTGLTAGFSVDALVGENKSAIGVEYCVRMSNPFGLINSLGISIALK